MQHIHKSHYPISKIQRQKTGDTKDGVKDNKNTSSLDQRKARMRFLIQLGALLKKSKLLESLGLEPGHDLQKDPETFDGVATLLGALLSLQDDIVAESSNAQKLLWKERGKKALAEKKRS